MPRIRGHDTGQSLYLLPRRILHPPDLVASCGHLLVDVRFVLGTASIDLPGLPHEVIEPETMERFLDVIG